jgi:predicted Zn-dependent protease
MLAGMKRCLRWGSLLALGALAGCYTVPETGRQAFILPLVDDVAQGTAAFSELKARGPISTNPEYNACVQRVGKRIAEAVGSDLPGANWEFVVFDEPRTVNAFALPGGKVGVSTGLLLLIDNDDQLAVVMGHEIGHVTARHGAQRVTEATVAVLGAVVLEVLTRSKAGHEAVLVGYGLVAGGSILTFSRAHEREADYIGIRYAAKAGYDPRAALAFWRKMVEASEGSRFTLLLRTHPLTITRLADLQKWMPEVLPLYETAKQRYK